jgi:hypothetical protein
VQSAQRQAAEPHAVTQGRRSRSGSCTAAGGIMEPPLPLLWQHLSPLVGTACSSIQRGDEAACQRGGCPVLWPQCRIPPRLRQRKSARRWTTRRSVMFSPAVQRSRFSQLSWPPAEMQNTKRSDVRSQSRCKMPGPADMHSGRVFRSGSRPSPAGGQTSSRSLTSSQHRCRSPCLATPSCQTKR